MKNKILGIMILMAICLASVSAVQAGYVEKIIEEGQTQTVILDNTEYEVTALVVAETVDECKLRINGEVTDSLGTHDSDNLVDGSTIVIKDISESSITYVISRSEPDSCRDTVLRQDEQHNYRIGNDHYTISAYFVDADTDHPKVKIKINGEISQALNVGENYRFGEGGTISEIKILAIRRDSGMYKVAYCIESNRLVMSEDIPEQAEESSQPENKIDLSNFPELFIKGKSLNGIFVVGDQAPADDVIAAIDISMSFQKYGVSKTGDAKLASEISNYNRNIISVGRPCDNAVTAQILRANGISDYDFDCSYGLKPTQAIVYLFDYHGYAHMLVFGYSRLETRQAARQLTFQKLKGTKQLLGFTGDRMPQPEESSRGELYCEDSDGGIEPYKTGQVYIPDSDDIQKKEDTCYIPEEILEGGLPSKGNVVESCRAGELCYVTETYCSRPAELEKTVIGIKYIPCPQGCKYGACIKDEKEPRERVPEPPIRETEDKDCPGCRKNGACMQIGIRFLEGDAPVYCDIDHAFKPQLENGKECMNNYECLSNTCQDGVCQSMSEQIKGIQRELEEQKGILEKIMGFFKRMFSF